MNLKYFSIKFSNFLTLNRKLFIHLHIFRRHRPIVLLNF